jgi:6-phosphofructokinase
MGRDCGWIALAGGIAGGARVILIPEIPFTIKSVCDFIAERERRGGRFTIVVVAEGIKLPPELKQMARGWPVGNTIGDAIGLFSDKKVRVSVLGHIQRGGSPSPYDRVLATRFGVAAVEMNAEGGFGKMVALRSNSIVAVDVAKAIGQLKSVHLDRELVRTRARSGLGLGTKSVHVVGTQLATSLPAALGMMRDTLPETFTTM